MLDLLYITHLQQNEQKNLAYAFKLAESFSSPLSLLPVSGLANPKSGKIPIWPPQQKALVNNREPIFNAGKQPGLSKERLPVCILGKSSQSGRPNAREYQIVKQVLDAGNSLFLLPYDYPFRGIRKVLFTSNAPGFTDHRLKHQIAATFQPRAYKIGNAGLKSIHWNNICHIPETNSPFSSFSFRYLDLQTQRHNIDLTVFPVTDMSFAADAIFSKTLYELLLYKTPILLIPLMANDHYLQEMSYDHTDPLLYNTSLSPTG